MWKDSRGWQYISKDKEYDLVTLGRKTFLYYVFASLGLGIFLGFLMGVGL